MAIYWQSDAVRRAGISDADLIRLSENSAEETEAIVQAWSDNLVALTPAEQQVQEIIDRNPAVFAKRSG